MIKSFILALVMVMSVVACNDGHQVPRENRILRYDIPATVGSLNPLDRQRDGATFIDPFLFSCLCVPDEKGALQPDLAVSWDYDPSELNWTIEIRKNARFHDGAPVTTGDVKFSIQRYLTWPRNYLRNSLKRIDIISPTRLSIVLNKADPDFINKIWDINIVSELLGESKDFSDYPIGSGPFKFKSRRDDRSIELVANEDYYAGKSLLAGVTFFQQTDKEKSWSRLMGNQTDIVHEIPPKNYQIMSHIKKKFNFDISTLQWYSILLYNTKDPLFSDVRVRRALTHAINRQYIIENIIDGYGKVAVGPMGVDTAYSNQNLKPLPYNPQKSLDLLQLSGWSMDKKQWVLQKDGKIFEFTILCCEEGIFPIQVAQCIQLNLHEIGIKAHLQILSQEELIRRYLRNDQFQAVLTECKADQRIPELNAKLWTPMFYDCSSAGCFEDKEVTRLARLLVSENDPEKIKSLCWQLDARIAYLQPGTFLYHRTIIDVMSDRISLPFPFALTQCGASRLWRATIK